MSSARIKFILFNIFIILISCNNYDNYKDSIVASSGRDAYIININDRNINKKNKIYYKNHSILEPFYSISLKSILMPEDDLFKKDMTIYGIKNISTLYYLMGEIDAHRIFWPSVSPNGQYLSFLSHNDDFYKRLIIYDMIKKQIVFSDKSIRICGKMHGYGHRPVWLPNSRGIICDTIINGKEFLLLLEIKGGKKFTSRQLCPGFAPAISENWNIAFFDRDNIETSKISICVGQYNLEYKTIDNIKQIYRSRYIVRHLSPAWSKQNKNYLYFIKYKFAILDTTEPHELCVINSENKKIFHPDKNNILKYSLYFGFDTLPETYN